jgi:hypothetical protein
MTAKVRIKFPWTEAAITQLREGWEKGITVRDLGRLIGCGKNAVSGKIDRLNLPHRPSPIIKNGVRQIQPPRRLERSVREKIHELSRNGRSERQIATETGFCRETVKRVLGGARRPLTEVFDAPLPVAARPVIVAPAPLPLPPPIPNSRRCEWRFGDTPRTFVQCPNPSEQGLSWCDEHRGHVFTRRKD